MNEYINLTEENIEKEHLCCAIADKKHQTGVNAKRDWIKSQIQKGHIFRKLNAQGKVFIEYSPLEQAFVPIKGNDFMYIYCLWVAGSFKGKGYANELLNYAIEDAKKQNKKGLCVISSKKKKPFLSEKSFFEKYGFKSVDSVSEFELLALCFGNEKPAFSNNAKLQKIDDKRLTIYYSPQCPYTNNCIEEITDYCKQKDIDVNIVKVDTLQKAKEMPCMFNNWAVFVDGEYKSNILLNKNSLEKLLNQ